MGYPLAVGPECTIGHNVVLHGCAVGAHSLIGMGATLLNGVKIGRYSIVGAGALITEGKEFPDHSLIVGAPARALRTIDDAGIKLIDWSAELYVANWRRYIAGLKRLRAAVARTARVRAILAAMGKGQSVGLGLGAHQPILEPTAAGEDENRTVARVAPMCDEPSGEIGAQQHCARVAILRRADARQAVVKHGIFPAQRHGLADAHAGIQQEF